MANQPVSTWLERSRQYFAIIAVSCFMMSQSDHELVIHAADDAFESDASWQQPDAATLSQMMRESLTAVGTSPPDVESAAGQLAAALDANDADPLNIFINTARAHSPLVEQLAVLAAENLQDAGSRMDSDNAAHINLSALPKSLQASVRTWLGRELVRVRLYDEALLAFKEVDPAASADPAATLFFRGACYHALLQKKEAIVDLQRLLENEKDCPIRFTRTAQLMVADISPMKEDSLDEISRLMTDVTRRLDLGRADDNVQDREQKIIDKLSKLIEHIEQQQQQQQQQSAQSQGNSQGDQAAPMNESQAAGGSGTGDVDRKRIEERDGWGKLPPAERKEALQQISRDLPTHYREAIEAYFRKLATEGS